jgi:hypothetical protein
MHATGNKCGILADAYNKLNTDKVISYIMMIDEE